VWGQWNVIVKGPERVKKVILESDLREGWPHGTPPVTLLGKSCPALLDEEEAGCLQRMISGPLSHASVVKYAPQFAELAQECVDNIIAGKFNKGEKEQDSQDSNVGETGKNSDDGESAKNSDDGESDKNSGDGLNTSHYQSSDGGEKLNKIKLDALRSYTYSLIDGPVLNLDKCKINASGSSQLKDVSGGALDDGEKTEKKVRFENDQLEDKEEAASQEILMLWIDRLKDGLCDIKFTWGPDWMQIWRLNWYGRALNARKHLERILAAHIEETSKLVPVHHEKGRATRDPFTSPLPLLKMTENYFHRKEHPMMGIRKSKIKDANRTRTRSEPDLPHGDFDDISRMEASMSPNGRSRAQSEPDAMDVENARSSSVRPKAGPKKIDSVLDQILREEDFEGRGITRVATAEMSLLVWMMMDAGQAWTAMALNLLSKHEVACHAVQSEVDRLERAHGKERLFTSFVLGKMEKLDNLVYEAMRFTPAFMGGMKILEQTVELDGVQIPKNTNVILCNSHSDDTFSIDYPTRKRPEEMSMFYPTVDL
jgi:hypothetical protein